MHLGTRILAAALTALLGYTLLVPGTASSAAGATYAAPVPVNRACGTWVLQQVSSATELSRQAVNLPRTELQSQLV